MLPIVLVILRFLGLRKANVRYCSSDFKVLGLEKSSCSPVVRDYVPFLRFFPYHTCVVPVYSRVPWYSVRTRFFFLK